MRSGNLKHFHFLLFQSKPFNQQLREIMFLFALASSLTLAFYCQQSLKREREALLDQLSIQAKFTAVSSQSFFDSIGHSMELASRMLGEDEDPAIQLGLLKQILAQQPEIIIISTFNAKGDRLISVRRLPNGQIATQLDKLPATYANRFTQVLTDINSSRHYAVGKVEFGKITHQWVIPFHFAGRSKDRRINYIISASIPVSQQTNLWSNMKLPHDTRIGLYRDDGYIEARWPEVGFSEDKLYGNSKLPQSPLEAIVKAKKKRGIYEGYNSANGDVRLGAYARLPHLPLTAFASVPTSLVYVNWWEHNYALMIIFAACFVMFFIFAQILIRREKDFSTRLLGQANTDGLTNLLNRKASEDFLARKLKAAETGHTCFAVMFIDLDRFKAINDTYGHDYGDIVLKKAAQRLKRKIREGDILGRLGGDEFLAVIDCKNSEQAQAAAERFLTAARDPFVVNDQSLHLSMSIGIALYPIHGRNVDALLKNADIAMYTIKKANRNGHALYSDTIC